VPEFSGGSQKVGFSELFQYFQWLATKRIIPVSRLLLAQSGGATAVINSSLVGAVQAAQQSDQIEAIAGARNGIEGLLAEDLVDLGAQPAETLARLKRTPSAALGTTRQKLTDEMAERALEILGRYGIDLVAFIGGNDTADSAMRLAATARQTGHVLRVISIPKTIDNDLPNTDHCPGYGSIARFIAQATRSSGIDTTATAQLYPVKLIEVMGRNAGWVAASSALGQEDLADPPHLIFFPERPVGSIEDFLEEIVRTHAERGQVVAVIPETMRDREGNPLSGNTVVWRDSFGHPYYGGPGPALTSAIQETLGLRARYDKPGTISRMFEQSIAEPDLIGAQECGAAGVRLLLEGHSEVMVTIERTSNEPFRITTGYASLETVANRERLLPDEFIGPDGRTVTGAFRDYALPLIGGKLEPYGRLEDRPFQP
jgi:ATP-dependent phosphofructokinase / diphosphate-dependent phosphofructokinase